MASGKTGHKKKRERPVRSEKGLRPFLRLAKRATMAYLKGDADAFRLHRRRMAFLLLAGEDVRLRFERDGVSWTVPGGEDEIARSLFVAGRYQNPQLEALLTWLDANGRSPARYGWMVDVGANIGVPSIPLARRTGRRVLAIEPVPRNFEFLQVNVRDNGLDDRIVCVHAAAAAGPGRLTMMAHPRGGRSEVATEGGAQGFGASDGVERVEVPAVTLEGILADRSVAPSAVAFVWSDTQGYEGEVIRGGASLWRAGTPLFCELWPKGLEVHGGIAAFAAVAASHFRGFIPRDRLLAETGRAQALPIDELERTARQLRRDHTDVLLLPR